MRFTEKYQLRNNDRTKLACSISNADSAHQIGERVGTIRNFYRAGNVWNLTFKCFLFMKYFTILAIKNNVVS